MWTDYISSISILVPLTLGIRVYDRISRQQRLFLIFIMFSVVIECISAYTFYRKENNFWLLKLFLVCDFAFFSWYLKKIITFPTWAWVYAILLIPVLLIVEFYIKPVFGEYASDSMFYFVLLVFLIIQSGIVIIEVFDNFNVDILNNYIFWIAFARLLYYLIIVFIYIYPNFAEKGFYNDFFSEINFVINATANVILNILYGISFICQKAKN